MSEKKPFGRRVLRAVTGPMADFGSALAPDPVSRAIIACLKLTYASASGIAQSAEDERRARRLRRGTQDDLREILTEMGLGEELRGALVEAQVDRDEIGKTILAAVAELGRRLDARNSDAAGRDAGPLSPAGLHTGLVEFVQTADALRGLPAELRGLAGELRQEIARIPILWDAEAQRSVERAEYEKAYLAEITRVFGDLELLGIDHDDLPENKRYALDVGYITLNVSRPRAAAGDALFEAADELLLIEPRLAVVGPAGSGKTTLMQWVAVQCAAGATYARGPRAGQLNPWHGCVPYLIRLRRRTAEADAVLPPLAEWAKATLPDWGVAHPADWVSRTIEEHRAILMIDGLDELAAARREKVWQELAAQLRGRERLRVYVTSRELADDPEFKDQWRPPDGMATARLQPLSDAQIDQLVDQWFEAKGGEHKPPPMAELARLAAALKGELRREGVRWVRQLAETPFLCAVICLVFYHRKGDLPENRAKLYNHCCRALLKTRDRASGVAPDPEFDSLSDDELMELHGRIALDMLLCPPADDPLPASTMAAKPGQRRKPAARDAKATAGGPREYRVEASRGAVLVWLNEAIANVKSEAVRTRLHRPGATPEQLATDTELNRFLDHLKVRRALLREPSVGKIDFHHRALQDYLAAYAIPVCRKIPLLIERSEDDRWREVILLAPGGGRIGDAGVEELVSGLIAKAEHTGSRRCIALAVGCFDTAIPTLGKLRAQALALLAKAVPPESMDEAEALAIGGAEAARLLTFTRDKALRIPTRKAAACVRTLRRIGGAAAREGMAAFLDRGDGEVVAELGEASEINPLEVAYYRACSCAADTLALPDSIRARVVDLQPLAGLTQLQYLHLIQTGVSDLGPLKGLTQLRELWLNQTGVSDLAPLRGLTQLRRLLLDQTGVSDLGPLAGLTQLRVLSLDQTGVSDLGPLRGLTQLQRLYLNQTAVSDLGPLGGLTQLQGLHLNQTGVSDLGPLRGLKKVTIYIDDRPGLRVPRELEGRVHRGPPTG